MIRRPPRSTLDRSSAASDVYKRQLLVEAVLGGDLGGELGHLERVGVGAHVAELGHDPVSYKHLRAHETVLDLVCRLLLEKKNSTEHHTTS